MEKQLSVLGYWLGVISLALALIFRLCRRIWHQHAAFGCGKRQRDFLHDVSSLVLRCFSCWRLPVGVRSL